MVPFDLQPEDFKGFGFTPDDRSPPTVRQACEGGHAGGGGEAEGGTGIRPDRDL